MPQTTEPEEPTVGQSFLSVLLAHVGCQRARNHEPRRGETVNDGGFGVHCSLGVEKTPDRGTTFALPTMIGVKIRTGEGTQKERIGR